MQRMGPDIPPEPIQAHLRARSPATGDLEYTRGNPEARVRRYYFDTRDPLGQLAALACCKRRAALGVCGVDPADFETSAVRQCNGSAEMGMEVAVGGENVEFVYWRFFVVASEWPCSSGSGRVFGCIVKGAEGDAKIKVAED